MAGEQQLVGLTPPGLPEPSGPGPAAPTGRPAQPADLPTLVELHSQALAELSHHRGGTVFFGLQGRGDARSAFESQLADPGQLVVVGMPSEATTVVGFGTARTRALSDGSLLGAIEDLFVLPAHRRQGVGRAMAGLLVGWCQAKGCVGVDAWALPGSRAAKSFFESGRFTARALLMHHKLGGAGR